MVNFSFFHFLRKYANTRWAIYKKKKKKKNTETFKHYNTIFSIGEREQVSKS